MKIKTTRNELTALGLPIIKIPYCGCQTLVNFQEPIAYNAGAYGWNYDVYKINNTLLVTGRTMPINGHPAKYFDEFEKRAKRINNSYQEFDKRKANVDSVLIEWIQKELNG